jgi:hypothetical protein
VSIYNAEYNKDLSYSRHIIVAFLQELSDRVYWYNVIDEDSKIKINVPFYYSVTGQERFLLDNFLFDNLEEGKAIGDYEKIPRGIVQLDSLAIDSESLINKFVRTQIIRPYQGQLKTFALLTQAIPVIFNFTTTVIVSNTIELFKASEALISSLYKNNIFYVDYGGFQAQSTFQLPPDFDKEQLFEYTFNDRKEYKISFTLEVRSFFYIFEGGLQLAEIPMKVVESSNNSKLAGVGLYYGDGIYFGNVMESIISTIDDYRKAPYSSIESNTDYNNLSDTDGISPTGPIYSETIITSNDISNTESLISKKYRNSDI